MASFATLTSISFLQPENAYSPILLTLLGIITLSKSSQSSNACSPILVTPIGIIIFFNPLHFRNAPHPILFTHPFIGITLILHPQIKLPFFNSIKQLPIMRYATLSAAMVIFFKLLHPSNTPSAILLTLLGIVILNRSSHSPNALSPIIVLLRLRTPLLCDARNVLRHFFVALAKFIRFGKRNRLFIFVRIAEIFV